MASTNVSTFLFLLFFTYVSCAPLVQNNKTEDQASTTHEPPGKPIDFELPYGKYLQEVMNYLEKDPSFKKYLEKATEEDISSGKLADQLQFVSHHIRNQLDEVKRRELNRLKSYARRMDELSNGVYSDNDSEHLGIDREALARPIHVDSRNPHTFEIEDLTKLIKKTTEDLEESNRQRRKEFKEYEMEKEWERRDKLKQMDEEHRKQAEKEFDEQQKKQKDHPKVHHPGSKAQLEDVWEKEDHLPTEEFDPDTLFSLHDLNGDGHWSEDELMAMFIKEVEKEGGDTREREEEMHRMKDHVMNETDTNGDRLISKKEFDAMIARQDFNQDPEWNGIEDQQLFDDREFEEYQRSHHPGYYPPPPVYVPPGGQPPHGAQYQYVPPPNGYPVGQQPPYPHDQGNQVGQMQYPGGQGYPQGNYQYQQPPQFQQGNHQDQYQQVQFQQGGHPAQFQQGGQQSTNFQPGNQQQHFQQGGQQPPPFQQGGQRPPQFQQGGQQPPQFQQGNQIPQIQNQQFQPNAKGQQQINQGTFSSSTDSTDLNHAAVSSTNKAEESIIKASESQIHS
ncbi:Nucleobindin-1 [Chamberlinius hualienensis]